MAGWSGRGAPQRGAQLRFTDGMRLTCFATNAPGAAIAGLELRHRLRARCEDRIRDARAAGLRNLPLHGFGQNQVWPKIVQLALDLEPKKLCFRMFSAAAQVITTGRRRYLRLAAHWPWTDVISAAADRIQDLPNPG